MLPYDDRRPATTEPGTGDCRRSATSRRTHRGRLAFVSAGTAAATVLLLAGGGVASAAPSGRGFPGFGRGGGLVGTLKSVSGSTLTVTTTAGKTETAEVTSKTTYDKTSTGTISLLTNGAKVTAVGTLASGSLDASRVMIGTAPAGFPGGPAPAGFPGGGRPGGGTPPVGGPGAAGGVYPTAPMGRAGFTFVTGTVSDITATSFTLTESSGTKGTVHVASTTSFTDTTKISESALTVGQTVSIRGTAAKSGTVTALAVMEGQATGFGFGFGGGFGGHGRAGHRPPAA